MKYEINSYRIMYGVLEICQVSVHILIIDYLTSTARAELVEMSLHI
jgi:hypothetical protein